MGLAKSIVTAILSFVVFTTLPLAITSFFFMQEMDLSGGMGGLGGDILGTFLQDTGMLDQLSDQLAGSLPELQAICSIYPSWTVSDIFTNATGPGMPGYDAGGAEALIDSIMPCFDIPCSEIMTMDVTDLTNRFTQDLSNCDIELPDDFVQDFNMTDFGGGFGDFDFGGLLSQLSSLTDIFNRLVVYMIIAGIICAILLLIISRDIGYFSRRMGMIFLITGISFIVMTFVLKAILPGILGGMMGSMGDTVSSMVTSLIIDPMERMFTINLIYIIGGGIGVAIGTVLKKRNAAAAEFETK